MGCDCASLKKLVRARPSETVISVLVALALLLIALRAASSMGSLRMQVTPTPRVSRREMSSASVSTIIVTIGDPNPQFVSQTMPVRRLQLDSSSDVTVSSFMAGNVGWIATLSNGTVLVPSTLLANYGFIPPSGPLGYNQRVSPASSTDHLRIEGLPAPSGTNFSSAATSASPGAPTTLLKTMALVNYNGVLYLYDNGDLYYSRMPFASQTYVDALHLSEINNDGFFTARLINSDPAVLNGSSTPPRFLRLVSAELSTVLAFASNGRVYSTGSVTLQGYPGDRAADFPLRLPFERAIDFPTLTQHEMENIDSLPIAIGTNTGLAYLNGSLYAWGINTFDKYLGFDGLVTVETPVKVDLSTILPETASPTYYPANITHLALSSTNSLIILADGRSFVFQFAGKIPLPFMTSFIQAQPAGDSSCIVSVTGLYWSPEYVILLTDGTVWTYATPNPSFPYFSYFGLSWSDFSQVGPWKSDFGAALPDGFKVKQVARDFNAGFYSFLATAPAASVPTITPILTQPPPKSQRMVIIDPGYAFSQVVYTEEVVTPNTFQYYPDAELNQFAQIAIGGYTTALLTRNGSLLLSSMSQPGALPMDRVMSVFEWPILVDQRPFENQPIFSVACGSSGCGALLANGKIALWSVEIGNMLSATESPAAPASATPVTYQAANAMPGGDNTLKYAQPDVLANYTALYANDQRYFFTDSLGRIFSVGVWSVGFNSTLVSHSALMTKVGAIKKLGMAQSISEFWVIAGNSSSTLSIVRCTAAPDPSPAFSDSRLKYFLYNSASNSPQFAPGMEIATPSQYSLDLASVRSMASGVGYALLLTDSGLYGIGANAMWFTRDNAAGVYDVPTEVVMPGLPPTSLLKKISIEGSTLLALSFDGKLYSTCDWTILARCTEASAQIVHVAARYNISLLSDVGASLNYYRAVLAEADDFVTPRDLSTPYLNLMTGGSTAFFGWGSSQLEGTDGQILLLPAYHPLDSDNVTNIRSGDLLSFDYQVNDTTSLFSTWSAVFTNMGGAQYVEPSPAPVQPQEDPNVVYYGALDAGFIVIYRNCTTHLYLSPAFDSSVTFPLRTTINADAWKGYDPAQESTSQVPHEVKHFYNGKPLPMQRYEVLAPDGYCVSSDTVIEKVYCDSVADLLTTDFQTWFFYCLLVDSNGTLWSRGSWRGANTTLDSCSNAMYGEFNSCEANMVFVAENDPGSAPTCPHWITNQLPASPLVLNSTSIADASIGKKHVMILLADGSVAVYGNNWRGQLARDPSTLENSTSLIAVPINVFSAGSAVSQVLATGRTSYAVSSDKTQIASWGSNLYGELGRIIANPSGSDMHALAWNIGLVQLPTGKGKITDFKCTDGSCFVLFGDLGEVYSWGSSMNLILGRRVPAAAIYDPIPALADLLQFPSGGPPRIIKELITSKFVSLVIFRAAIDTRTPQDEPTALATTPAASPISSPVTAPIEPVASPSAPVPLTAPTTAPESIPTPTQAPIAPSVTIPSSSVTPPVAHPAPVGCSGSPPSTSFFCQDGIWTFDGSVTIGGGSRNETGSPSTPGASSPSSESTFPVTSPTKIFGSVTVTLGGTVVLEPPATFTSDGPLLNVTGCFNVTGGGSLEIKLDPATWSVLKTKLNSQSILMVESGCQMLTSPTTVAVTTPKDCRKTKARLESVKLNGDRYGLQSTFIVDSSDCSRWWIILVSVLGGVIILVGIIILVSCAVSKSKAQQSRKSLGYRNSLKG